MLARAYFARVGVTCRMDREQLLELLRHCEARLVESRRSIDEVLSEIRRAVDAPDVHDVASPPFGALMGVQREELVGLVLAALDSAPKARANHDAYMNALVRRPDDGYRLGRRRIALTETEKNVLDMLWNAMPEPVSRSTIHEALYAHGNKPSAGAIDVFVSKLRQKLKLASGGTEFVESIRGKGWALKPELCRAGELPAETEARTLDRRSA